MAAPVALEAALHAPRPEQTRPEQPAPRGAGSPRDMATKEAGSSVRKKQNHETKTGFWVSHGADGPKGGANGKTKEISFRKKSTGHDTRQHSCDQTQP